jgi:hypothetical protein
MDWPGFKNQLATVVQAHGDYAVHPFDASLRFDQAASRKLQEQLNWWQEHRITPTLSELSAALNNDFALYQDLERRYAKGYGQGTLSDIIREEIEVVRQVVLIDLGDSGTDCHGLTFLCEPYKLSPYTNDPLRTAFCVWLQVRYPEIMGRLQDMPFTRTELAAAISAGVPYSVDEIVTRINNATMFQQLQYLFVTALKSDAWVSALQIFVERTLLGE